MVYLKIKRIGNHWYPCIDHDDLQDISLSYTIENKLNSLASLYPDKDEFTVELQEVYALSSDNDRDLLFLFEEDLTKFYTTDEDFDIRFEVNDQVYQVSSSLFECLDEQFDINFHESFYRIVIW